MTCGTRPPPPPPRPRRGNLARTHACERANRRQNRGRCACSRAWFPAGLVSARRGKGAGEGAANSAVWECSSLATAVYGYGKCAETDGHCLQALWKSVPWITVRRAEARQERAGAAPRRPRPARRGPRPAVGQTPPFQNHHTPRWNSPPPRGECGPPARRRPPHMWRGLAAALCVRRLHGRGRRSRCGDEGARSKLAQVGGALHYNCQACHKLREAWE